MMLVGLSSARTLQQAIGRGRRRLTGWIVVSAAVLVLMGIAAIFSFGRAGAIGAVPWAILILAPSLLLRRARQATAQGRWREGAIWYTAAIILHPADGWPEERRLASARRLIRDGKPDLARTRLLHISAGNTRMAPLAQAMLMACDQRWEELADWMHLSMAPEDLADQPDLMPIFMRSLGETGDLTAMLSDFSLFAKESESGAHDLRQWICAMMTMAFGGRVGIVERMVGSPPDAARPAPPAGPFAAIPADQRAFWLATAEMARGNRDHAARLLRPFSSASATADQRAAAERRLSAALCDPASLDPSSRRTLALIELDLTRRLDEADAKGVLSSHPWTTWFLIIINCIVFGFELWHEHRGMDEELVLNQMGAMLPPGMLHYQWWRFIAANFLHAGWLHIGMNMLALAFLGPFVESALKIGRYVGIYMLSGVIAISGVWLLQRIMPALVHPDSLVGASGAILGLIGATAAIQLRRWMRDRRPQTKQRLVVIGWMILLQVIFDAANKYVSSSAHLIGCFAGFILTLLLWRETHRSHLKIASEIGQEMSATATPQSGAWNA